MSSVRMCDRCGGIFSEAEDGWQTGAILTVNRKGFDVKVQHDLCPSCAVGVSEGEGLKPTLSRGPRRPELDQPAPAVHVGPGPEGA